MSRHEANIHDDNNEKEVIHTRSALLRYGASIMVSLFLIILMFNLCMYGHSINFLGANFTVR